MRELPNNKDAEMWLLGGVFQDPKAMAQFAGELYPADFYGEKNRLVWQAMQLLQKRNEPIDIISVAANLKKADAFNSLFGNNDYLFALMESVSSAANADYYVEIIKDCANKRKLIEICESSIKEALDPCATATGCIENALERISEIAKRSYRAAAEHIGETSVRTLKDMKQSKNLGLPSGIKTPFAELDQLTDGLRKGELTIIGARPGVGKTSLALGIAINAAIHSGNALMFSLEMSRMQLAARAMCYNSKVNLKRTVANALSIEETVSQEYAAEYLLRNVPLHVLYERDLTAKQIAAISHSYAAKKPLSLIIIDHLQIINTNADRKGYENRNIAIGEATRIFKVLSGKLNCPVLVLSQLNRDLEKSGGKKPSLKDLRDSGNIEADADSVLLLHRLIKGNDMRDCSETDIIVAKNRSGPPGEVKIHFNPENAMFTGLNDSFF